MSSTPRRLQSQSTFMGLRGQLSSKPDAFVRPRVMLWTSLLAGHRATVLQAFFLPDSKTVVTTGIDAKTHLWEVSDLLAQPAKKEAARRKQNSVAEVNVGPDSDGPRAIDSSTETVGESPLPGPDYWIRATPTAPGQELPSCGSRDRRAGESRPATEPLRRRDRRCRTGATSKDWDAQDRRQGHGAI
jgi:hypothetical protein